MSFPARRNFLKQAGISVAAVAAVPLLARTDLQPVTSMKASEGSPDDEAFAIGQQQAWDTNWVSRLTTRHRAVFDIPEVQGGVGVLRAALWGTQYMETLHVTRSDLSTVVVIRHNAIPLAMNQEFWTIYDVAGQFKLTGENGRGSRLNPVLPAPGTPPGTGTSASGRIDDLIAGGAIVLGCNLAFRFVVSLVQNRDGLKQAAAREKAVSMLIPGVIMQPSGFFACVLAQENGCAFVNAV